MTNRIKNALLAVSALTAVGLATEASAGGFALREQSSYYQGMSFAGYGTTGPSISSIFWNPATITGAGDGLTFETHNTVIVPTAKMDGTYTGVPFNSSAPSGDIANDAYVPASYTAYKVTDQVFFGLAINAPFGLSTKPNENWAGQFYSRSSKAASLNVTPMIGYKFNEMLSFAFGLQIQQFAVALKTGIPAAGFPTASLEGDDISFGVTAGVTLKPIKGTEIGLGYRSGISHQLSGTFATPFGITPITANMITPDMVNLSVKQRVTDAFRVLGTVEWTNWSRLKTPRAVAANGVVVAPLPFNYSDGWYFALGGEYDFNEDLTLRAGIGYELSPIDTDIRSTRLPDNDRLWLSAGASYQVLDNLAMDFGYTYIHTANTRVAIGPGHQDYNGLGTYNSKVDANVNIVSASLRYTWGGPVDRPALDPVRKY